MLSKPLVIGRGEIGQALVKILTIKYDVASYDLSDGALPDMPSPVEVLHICIPYSETFESTVTFYQGKYKPEYTIIHSTVPVGTSSRLGAFHSPVRGRTPNIAEAMRTFVTYLAPMHRAAPLEDYMRAAGFHIETMNVSEETEAAKLWDTLQYGWSILLEKSIHAFCEKNGLDFSQVYRDYGVTYNEGYAKLGEDQFIRPVLDHVPGPISGHCVIPNAHLLGGPIANMLIHMNGIEALDAGDYITLEQLERSIAQADAGDTIPFDEVMAGLDG